MNKILKILLLSLCFFLTACGESGRRSTLPATPRGGTKPLIDLASISYQFEGSCSGERSHRLVSFPGVIEYEQDSERYLIHQLEFAIHWEDSTYQMAKTSYYADDVDYTPTTEITDGTFIKNSAGHLDLDDIGRIKLEISGQKLRPFLSISSQFLTNLIGHQHFGLVLRKASSPLFPDC